MRFEKSDTIGALAKALGAFQAEVENADKTANNPAFKTKYADLGEITSTIRPLLSKHGLAFTQLPSFEGGIVFVENLLMHESGEWLSTIVSTPITKQDAQGVGSGITYCRRYGAAAVFFIAQEDDDANSSVGKGSNQVSQPAAVRAAPAQVQDPLAVQGWTTEKHEAFERQLSKVYDTLKSIGRSESYADTANIWQARKTQQPANITLDNLQEFVDKLELSAFDLLKARKEAKERLAKAGWTEADSVALIAEKETGLKGAELIKALESLGV